MMNRYAVSEIMSGPASVAALKALSNTASPAGFSYLWGKPSVRGLHFDVLLGLAYFVGAEVLDAAHQRVSVRVRRVTKRIKPGGFIALDPHLGDMAIHHPFRVQRGAWYVQGYATFAYLLAPDRLVVMKCPSEREWRIGRLRGRLNPALLLDETFTLSYPVRSAEFHARFGRRAHALALRHAGKGFMDLLRERFDAHAAAERSYRRYLLATQCAFMWRCRDLLSEAEVRNLLRMTEFAGMDVCADALSVVLGRQRWFPGFQFAGDELTEGATEAETVGADSLSGALSVMAAVLRVLTPVLGGWDLARWWVSPNAYLDDAWPMVYWHQGPEQVLAAAQYSVEAWHQDRDSGIV